MTAPPDWTVRPVQADELDQLLVLMRAYCDFYEVSPTDEDLSALMRAQLEDPATEGMQLIGCDSAGALVGFATLYWSWSTTEACRIGVMNDLFVADEARGQGLAEELIEACRSQCARRGARRLTWQTAPGNARAQAVYDRVGATREQWIDYWLAT